MRNLVRIVLSLALLLPSSEAFSVRPSFQRAAAATVPSTTGHTTSATELHAKKRRRRKASSDNEETADDLPDFDLEDEDSASSSKKTGNAPPTITTSVDGQAITAAMMGSSSSPSNRSVRDLLSDRSLEDKLKFDDDEAIAAAEELPDLIQMGREARGLKPETAATNTGGGGKKQARRVQRQAEAEARQAEEEDANPLITMLADVSFLQNDEGKVTGVKILEAGTWAGIYLLVAGELYINSPLFDRAAPLSPVVY
jgi:hypothetical protein